MKVTFIISLLVYLLLAPNAYGQKTYLLKYEVRGSSFQEGEKFFRDSLEGHSFVKSKIHALQEEGFLMANVMGSIWNDSSRSVVINTGEQYHWVELGKGNLPGHLLSQAGYDPKTFNQKPVSHQKVVRMFDRILSIAENQGYPFSSISLDSISQSENQLKASLYYEQGPRITFDSIQVIGDANVKLGFIQRKLNIVQGEPFSQKRVEEAVEVIRKLPYLKLLAPPKISFQNSEATVYLYLAKRKVNSIDGIIGFLPNEVEENKLLVTGQFDLGLMNVSGRGRNYSLHWQRLTQYSQNLEISALEPMVLGSVVDLSASFFLLKEDTTFINRDFRLGFGYPLSPKVYLDFFTRWKSGDLLSVPELGETLPDVLDYRYHNYGLSFQYVSLDDVLMPKRGLRIVTEGGIGNKKVLQNTGIPEELYNDIDAESLQFFGEISVEQFWQFSGRMTIMGRLRAGELASDNILENDMYRLGGLKSIRGFNENFFFTNRYVYANFEPRFYFEESSYFLLFVDVGRLEKSSVGSVRVVNHPLSLGGGLSLNISGGTFQFIYGMGKSNEQKMGINYAKIHFGYIGRF
ncbi:BamA/TamA family outer membrane protein [Echinicola sp. CAU 1574]|uniref:BamA/TamA family outer membrane protein n=1 Tax=Echinicola arenosa TaxID=2774144 RepID=A0ABR9AHY9_9BACT|nr:BamA/TamA family outer membrane protein [Echinicola arenosa]MBD8488335.1 BamA/TamA family outer membrane protein [Echinicola arenosa]